ncbi:MAG: peroxiredoxin family protein [Vicinamibacteria bacterium]|nr:peroxiredoxin family protein [Vicinamibacteria bacterium]
MPGWPHWRPCWRALFCRSWCPARASSPAGCPSRRRRSPLFFIGLIALISVLAAFYSIGYMRHYRDYGVGRYYPHFLLFIAGMYAVVTVTDLGLFFCLVWQLMTIPSFCLVRYEYRRSENVRAAWRYLVMMELACALVLAGAWLLSRHAPHDAAQAGFDIETLSNALAAVGAKAHVAVAALALMLIGFGIKAGVWPFGQLWLPDAHPAAPSPVSALLSGVMIKTGIYGLLRTFFWMIPREWMSGTDIERYPTGAWGAVLAVLGAVTLFMGTMQALKQEQSKRLLAFHSIGQVGYIVLGLGVCLALMGPGVSNAAAATLSLTAFIGALFHTLNHGAFKSLLFFNAGSMLYATDTQDLNRLGGLMRYMPLTAVTALIASFSIAGVPGFNGFASKWSIYVASILGGAQVPYLPVLGLIAILTSALTLASFIKFFGLAFLSRTSGLVAEKAGASALEPPAYMRFSQTTLAVICVLLGLFPSWTYEVIGAVLRASSSGAAAWLDTAVPQGGLFGVDVLGKALLSPLIFVLVLAALMALARALAGQGQSQRRVLPSWLCGYTPEAESNRYRAHGMYGEVKRYFGWVGGKARARGETRKAEE